MCLKGNAKTESTPTSGPPSLPCGVAVDPFPQPGMCIASSKRWFVSFTKCPTSEGGEREKKKNHRRLRSRLSWFVCLIVLRWKVIQIDGLNPIMCEKKRFSRCVSGHDEAWKDKSKPNLLSVFISAIGTSPKFII